MVLVNKCFYVTSLNIVHQYVYSLWLQVMGTWIWSYDNFELALKVEYCIQYIYIYYLKLFWCLLSSKWINQGIKLSKSKQAPIFRSKKQLPILHTKYDHLIWQVLNKKIKPNQLRIVLELKFLRWSENELEMDS